uniref:Uncharacterized protein n=1 Tax=Amphimedon queenslandica TaxID=400682 RepID=A0A1X7VA31_AMPQE
MADTLDDHEVQAIDSSSDESNTDIITDVSTTVTVVESYKIAEFNSCSTSSGVDLLDALQRPRASSCAKKQVLSNKNPRKSLASGTADHVKITPAQSVHEFSNK